MLGGGRCGSASTAAEARGDVLRCSAGRTLRCYAADGEIKEMTSLVSRRRCTVLHLLPHVAALFSMVFRLRFGELSVLLALLQVIDVETRSPFETSSNAGDEKVSPDAAP